MVSTKSITLLALAASVVTARPQWGHARFHFSGTGSMVAWPRPTGGHHHHHHGQNETGNDQPDMMGGNQAPSAGSPALPAADGSNIEQPTAANAAANVDATSTCTDLATFTQYVTSTDIATVTAGPARGVAAANPNEVTIESINSIPAGQFWGRPNHSGNGWGWGQSSAPAAAPTTFMTSAAPVPAAPSPALPSVGISVGVSMGGNPPAASSAAVPSSSSSAPAGTGSTGSSGGKKGLSYNAANLLSVFDGTGASWAYNWAAGAGGTLPSGVEFVPMLWGKDSISSWSSAVNTAIANGATHVLSFNEPDLGSQSNIDASTAAQLHKENITPLSGKVQTGSPAITNSAQAGQGLSWMSDFLSQCSDCKIDFLAFHWYNNPGTIDDFKSHVQAVADLGAQHGINKVWLTEFAVNGGADDQASFLQEALPYLDSQGSVERYAYFMVGDGQMLTNGALNSVGKAYSA